MAVRIEEAKGQVKALRAELENLVIPDLLVGIFAEGDRDAAIRTGAFLTSNGGAMVFVDKLWNTVAADVEPSFGADREWRTTQHHLANQALNEAARKVGYDLHDSSLPSFATGLTHTKDDVASLVRDRFRAIARDGLNLACIRNDLMDAVIAGELTERSPVIIIGATPEEKPSIASLFSRVVTHKFTKDFEAKKESVASILRGNAKKKTDQNAQDNESESA